MKNIKLKSYQKTMKEIPIVFVTDNTYLPFLDVSLRSLIANASKKFKYSIYILNTGLNKEKMDLIKGLEDNNFTIISNFLNCLMVITINNYFTF